MEFRRLLTIGLCLAAVGLGACGDDKKEEEPVDRCEEGQTYEAVAKPFLTAYCTRCHSASSTNRLGAPEDANFDTLAELREHGMHVAENVAEEMMPPPGLKPQPSTLERADFLKWLDCSGVAASGHHHDE